MSSEKLTSEQKSFLEECNLEFSERYTDADVEFMKIFDSEIPPPPIVSPWYGRQRFNNRDRDRPGGSYNNYRNRDTSRDYSENHRGREYRHHHQRDDREYRHPQQDRFRPY
ncbi:uncharacterized protein LOC126889267 [Diabrotica virgifera virgifera]|uniref:Uncharacterized protein LOC114341370 n=1 Tax=Diabrotica virgifera virgifera TaxID=50390 RepID=A0A6P7GPI6_DIAVI|nr:uncharacterized protein LOC126889267 [Diabrotica virgifera virgifera]